MWSAIRKLRENKWSYFKETFESEIKVSLFCLFLRFREFWSNGQNKKKKKILDDIELQFWVVMMILFQWLRYTFGQKLLFFEYIEILKKFKSYIW